MLPIVTHVPPHYGQQTYTVVKATHTSTAAKHDGSHYDGTSTASWSLTRKRSKVTISWMPGGLFSGLGTIDVAGKYTINATTDVPGACAWTAATGDREHPLAAPAPFDLGIKPEPGRPGLAHVTFTAISASLGNPYLGTECSTPADDPGQRVTSTLDVAPARLRSKSIDLKFHGARTDAEGVAYTWRTEIVLKRTR